MWFLWLGGDSPLFGKEKMTTFERLFIEDKATHKEPTRPYYKYINERWLAENILKEFNLDPATARILNGHVPAISAHQTRWNSGVHSSINEDRIYAS